MTWNDMFRWKTNVTLRTLYLLFLGQVISFLLALASFSSSLIANLGVHVPITQCSFSYLFLALVYGSILLYRRQKLLVPWYWYLLLGFVDVQGNYFFNRAFQFSSITSVTLLDCWTIAWVIILTWLFLNTQYSISQLSGAALCVLGLVLVFFSDAGVGGGGGSRPVLGDTLVIAATFFFALSNTGEEFCIKMKDRVEVVAMIGVYGLLVSLIEISVLEEKSLQSVHWSADILSGSTMFNLSLLTSDMWAVIVRIFLYHQQVDWLYYLAFAIVAVGLVIYCMSEKDSDPVQALEARSCSAQYQVIRNENITASRDYISMKIEEMSRT